MTSSGDPVELIVPASRALSSSIPLSNNPTSLPNAFPFIHTLSAKALIRDREQGKHAFPSSVSALFTPARGDQGDDKTELKAAYLEKDIIRLGTEYNLASRYTSFVAVDRSSQSRWISPPVQAPRAPAPVMPMFMMQNRTAPPPAQFSSRSVGPPPAPMMIAAPMKDPRASAPPPPRAFFPSAAPALLTLMDYDAVSPASSPSSASSSHSSASVSDDGMNESENVSYSAPQFSGTVMPPGTTPSTAHTSEISPGSLLTAVARLQQWHGSFQLDNKLLSLLGNGLKASLGTPLSPDVEDFARRVQSDLGVTNRDVGATLLAVVWMEKYAEDVEGGREETLDMREKAEAWIQRELGLEDNAVERLRMLKESIASLLGLSK